MKKKILILISLFISNPVLHAGTVQIVLDAVHAPSTVSDNNWSATQTFQSSMTVKDDEFSVGYSTFVIKNGLVGIGTTTPQGLLNVMGTVKLSQYLTQVETTSKTLTASDFGKTIVLDSTTIQTVDLPSVDSGDVGAWFRIIKAGTGKVIIDAADSDVISDSGAGMTIYNDVEDYATITLQLISATEWFITGGHGTWVTTE